MHPQQRFAKGNKPPPRGLTVQVRIFSEANKN
jgi:hypothetical protein